MMRLSGTTSRTFDPPSHQPRFVIRKQLRVGAGRGNDLPLKPAQSLTRQRLPGQPPTTPTPNTETGGAARR